MKVTSAILHEIGAMPVEAMAASLRFLAVQLETEERKRDGAAQRKSRQRARDNAGEVTPMSQPCHGEVTPLARVLDSSLTSKPLERKKDTPHNPPTPQNPLTSDVTRETYTPEFEEFWKAYPSRSGGRDKGSASKAYRAALKRASHGTILNGARAYARYAQHAGVINTTYVKQARTWLNGQCWNNDYSTNGVPSHGSPSKPNATALIDKFLNG